MPFIHTFRAPAFLVVLIPFLSDIATAQQCYYPNGSPAAELDGPCGGVAGGTCCPLNWQCLSNGLCQYPAEGYLQRSTCTDENWGPSCFDICTYNGTASGNEAILQCSDGRYCCDMNRASGVCCENPDATFFELSEGSVINTITSVNTAASLTSTPSSSAPSSTSHTTPSASSTQHIQTSIVSHSTSSFPTTVAPNTEATTTGVLTSMSTDALGGIKTVFITIKPTSTSAPSNSSSSSPSTTALVGIIVGVIGGLALLLIAIFLFLRHRSLRRANSRPSLSGPFAAGAEDMYARASIYRADAKLGPQEVDGVGVQRAGTVPGRGELYGYAPPRYASAAPARDEMREIAGREVVRFELAGDVPTKTPFD